jgi:hypothetical protein
VKTVSIYKYLVDEPLVNTERLRYRDEHLILKGTIRKQVVMVEIGLN